jgi:hypothetical protein
VGAGRSDLAVYDREKYGTLTDTPLTFSTSAKSWAWKMSSSWDIR